MSSSSEVPVANRHALAFGLAVACAAATGLFLLSGWLGVRPGRPAATRCDVIFQSDAGVRIGDTITGENSFGMGTHPLIGTVWPKLLGAINRQFAEPELASVFVCRAAAALGAGIGLGILFGCLHRIGWSRGRCSAAAAFLLASSYQVVACLPDHFALSSGILPAAFGIYLLARQGTISRRAATGLLAAFAALASGICLTNGLWPCLLLAGLYFEGRTVSWKAAVLASMAGIAILSLALVLVQRHGFRLPILWQAKQWLNLRILHDPPGAALRAVRGTVDPIVAPSPAIDTNNFDGVPMLTFEPSAGMPIWPFDTIRSLAAATWLAILALSLAGRWTPPARLLAIWIAWNLLFHNIWGDEFFLYSPHYGWALALLPFVSPGYSWKWLPLAGLVMIGQVLAFDEIAIRVREIEAWAGELILPLQSRRDSLRDPDR